MQEIRCIANRFVRLLTGRIIIGRADVGMGAGGEGIGRLMKEQTRNKGRFYRNQGVMCVEKSVAACTRGALHTI